MRTTALTCLLVVACGGKTEDTACQPTDEVCDGLDNDCDGTVDDADPDVQAPAWYEDGDGDGFGDESTAVFACQGPAGTVSDGGDCDDQSPTAYPGAQEVCFDGVWTDCSRTLQQVTADCWSGSLADAQAVLSPSQEGAFAGTTVAGAGDADGDGTPDLLVGGPGVVTAWLVHGPVTGQISLDDAAHAWTGLHTWDSTGAAVGAAGDVNDDGYDDVAIGAWGQQVGDWLTGAVYVFEGWGAARASVEDAFAQLQGGHDGDRAGWSLSAAGDTDGDGLADLLVGAPYDNAPLEDSGAAFLVRGPIVGTLPLEDAIQVEGEAKWDLAGIAVAGGGDTNGDGLTDIAVGAMCALGSAFQSGMAYVVEGPVSSSSLADADGIRLGLVENGYAGSAVAWMDADQDGLSDLVVGAPLEGSAGGGAVYLVQGPVEGEEDLSGAMAVLQGDQPPNSAGASVSAAGDVNGDGQQDLVVGAPTTNNIDAGGAWVVFGPMSGTLALSTSAALLSGEAKGDNAGASVAGVGDVDGDGLDDLLVGSPYHGGGTFAGAAYLVEGAPF